MVSRSEKSRKRNIKGGKIKLENVWNTKKTDNRANEHSILFGATAPSGTGSSHSRGF